MTLNFDLFTLAMSDQLNCIHPTQVPIFSILRLPVPGLWVITLTSHVTVTAHAPFHVTYHRGVKIFTFLNSLTWIFLFTLSLSEPYDEE